MNKSELKKIIAECVNDVIFTFNKKRSGITAEVNNSAPTFQVWHGSDMKEYSNVEELFDDKFFSGKSISDLVGVVEFTIA